MPDPQYQKDIEARQRKFERNIQKEDQIFQKQQAQTTLSRILIRPPKAKQSTPLRLRETQLKIKDLPLTPPSLTMAFINIKKFQAF